MDAEQNPALVEIAAILRTNLKNLKARVVGMKLGDFCGRCSGSGSYSYNATDGSRCYGCGGSGQVFPKDLAALKVRAQAAADNGAVQARIDQIRAVAITKKGSERLFAAWARVTAMSSYGKDWMAGMRPEHRTSHELNRICADAYETVNLAEHGTCTMRGYVKGSKVDDPIERVRILNAALATMEDARQRAIEDLIISPMEAV